MEEWKQSASETNGPLLRDGICSRLWLGAFARGVNTYQDMLSYTISYYLWPCICKYIEYHCELLVNSVGLKLPDVELAE